MGRIKKHMRQKIESFTFCIAGHLIFDLNKPAEIYVSHSGSTYIFFDGKKIKISDHPEKGGHDFFIDARMFLEPKQCLKYFIDNYLDKISVHENVYH